MKVILQSDVKGQGKKGDYVEVSDGYARNFLLPRKLAVEANSSNLNVLKGKKEAEAYHKEQEELQAKKIAEQLEKLTVKLVAKAGEGGKLFGSVTSKDIADQLKQNHHIVVDKRKIVLDDGLKSTGVHQVEIRLHPAVHAKCKVEVIPQ